MKDRRATYHQKNRQNTISQSTGQSNGGSGGPGSSPELVVNSNGSGTWVVVEQDQERMNTGDDEDDDNAPERLSPEEVDREDRLFMCQAMMKCADISNPVSLGSVVVASISTLTMVVPAS